MPGSARHCKLHEAKYLLQLFNSNQGLSIDVIRYIEIVTDKPTGLNL